MAKNIEPDLRKIGDYLKLDEDAVFVIPEYQRAYSWGIENCDKLWQDISDFDDNKGNDRYFFGTIIVNSQDHDTKLSLIDGQQRTTTFLLLLKALLFRINDAITSMPSDEDSESLRRGLQERRRKIIGILYRAETEDIPDMPNKEYDASIYANSELILENNSINEQYKDELNIILKAPDYECAEQKVQRIRFKHKDNKYINFFRNFKYFYVKSGELKEAKLNSFAKTLTERCEVIEIKSWQVEQAIQMFNSLNSDGLPLYDSDIISAQLYAEAKSQGNEKDFADSWKALSELANSLKASNVASIDSILMQQMYYTRAINKEIMSENGSVNVTTPGLRKYFTETNKDLLKQPIELTNGMINLAKIWTKVSEYPITQVLFKFNENSKLFLASYFYRFDASKITEEDIDWILECMLRLFAILELVDTGYSSNKFKIFLFGEEVKLVDKNISIGEIKKDFNNHINSNWDKDSIKELILDYDGNALVYLNEFLFAREKKVDFVLGSKYDIEHIMPASGGNLQEIRKDAGIASEEEFKGIVNKLGNKIVLEGKINRSIGNEWFRTKVSTTLQDKTGYIDSKYPQAQAFVSKYKDNPKPFWKKEDIEGATEKAAERITKFIFNSEL